MQRDNTAHRSCVPHISPTLPVSNPPATPPESSTKTGTNRRNVLKTPIVVLGTLAAFGGLAYFVPMVAMALACSAGLYLANTFVDGQFNRGRRHGK